MSARGHLPLAEQLRERIQATDDTLEKALDGVHRPSVQSITELASFVIGHREHILAALAVAGVALADLALGWEWVESDRKTTTHELLEELRWRQSVTLGMIEQFNPSSPFYGNFGDQRQGVVRRTGPMMSRDLCRQRVELFAAEAMFNAIGAIKAAEQPAKDPQP